MTALRLAAATLVLLGMQALPPPPPPPITDMPMEVAPVEAAPPARAVPPPEVERSVPDERLRALRANPDYVYDRPVVEQASLWERIMEAFWRLMARLFQAAGPDGTRYILWTLAIVALGWGLSRLLRADVGGPFRAGDRRAPAASDPLLDVDDIAEVDLATLLAQARAAGDRRAEIRLRYLLLIQRLAAAGALRWARDKTNRTYGQEVRAWDREGAIGTPFGDATRVFEYVWYGDYPATAARAAGLIADAEAVEAHLGVPHHGVPHHGVPA